MSFSYKLLFFARAAALGFKLLGWAYKILNFPVQLREFYFWFYVLRAPSCAKKFQKALHIKQCIILRKLQKIHLK